MKSCTKCGSLKNDSDFYIQKSKWGDRLASWCKSCVKEDRRIYRCNNVGLILKRRRIYREKNKKEIDRRSYEWRKGYFKKFPYKPYEYRIKSEYGISPEEFYGFIISQENKCFTCGKYFNHDGKKTNFGIDHCHSTGRVRGLLCFHCNSAIGMVRENLTTLENMIRYLKEK